MNLFRMLFQKTPQLTTQEMAELVDNGATLLDVRSPEEFRSGHSKKAKNFPVQQINKNWKELEALPQPIIAVCRSGGRSGMATKLLNSKGVKTYNAGPWDKFNTLLK